MARKAKRTKCPEILSHNLAVMKMEKTRNKFTHAKMPECDVEGEYEFTMQSRLQFCPLKGKQYSVTPLSSFSYHSVCRTRETCKSPPASQFPYHPPGHRGVQVPADERRGLSASGGSHRPVPSFGGQNAVPLVSYQQEFGTLTTEMKNHYEVFQPAFRDTNRVSGALGIVPPII
ncbi:hypothetical protein MC885_002621 [Smutsia gigantea]|nr:hypothetical protein MC885_002621 [Smutsia gigantea]